jgi:hypothetical protein
VDVKKVQYVKGEKVHKKNLLTRHIYETMTITVVFVVVVVGDISVTPIINFLNVI